MSSFEIDFEWPVAAKYELVEPDLKQASPATIVSGASPDWKLKAEGATKPARPLARGDLYLSIMKMQMTPQSVLHLVQQIGFLEKDDHDRGEAFSRWTELQAVLHEIERLSQRTTRLRPVPLGNVTAVLKNGASTNAIISFQPRDLRTAIILQCTQALISGCVIRACEGCGKWFEAGGHSGRRADATFHDDACRTRAKNLRNSGKRRGQSR